MPRTPIDRFEQRKATHGKLVDSALNLFSTSGYEHATIDDISAAAGYSKGAYYFHFSTKNDILLELLRMWTERQSAILTTAAADGASEESLRDTLEAFFSYTETPQWPGVLLEFWSQAVRSPEMSKRLGSAYASWRKLIAEAFERAAAAGTLSLASAEDAAAVTLAAHDGFAVQVAIGSPGGRAMTAAELAESIIAPLETAAAETARLTGTR